MRRCSSPSSQSSATATIGRAPRPGSGVSTRTRLKSQKLPMNVARTSVPCAHGSIRSHTAACFACRQAIARSRGVGASAVVVLVVCAGAADHDLVLLDRHLDRAMSGPVLGVDRVVLDGGIQPQAVALLAMVERALERPGRCALASAGAARTRAALGLLLRLGLGLGIRLGCLGLGGFARGLLGSALLLGLALLFAASLFGLELGSDRGVVFGAQVDLLIGRRAVALGVALGFQAVLALEGLDLLDRDLELVRDPRVGPTLAHPPANLVKLRTQRPAAHQEAGRLAQAGSRGFGCRPHSTSVEPGLTSVFRLVRSRPPWVRSAVRSLR